MAAVAARSRLTQLNDGDKAPTSSKSPTPWLSSSSGKLQASVPRIMISFLLVTAFTMLSVALARILLLQQGSAGAVAASAEGDALRRGLEEVVRSMCELEKRVIVTRVKYDELPLLHNWLASVLLAGYGSQVLFVAEDERTLEALRGEERWRQQVVLLDPSVASSRVDDWLPRYLEAILSFDVIAVHSKVDSVWLHSPFGWTGGTAFDMWLVTSQPPKRYLTSPAKQAPTGPMQALRRLDDERLSTAFMVLRPDAKSTTLLARWREILEWADGQGEPMDSELALNHAIKGMRRPKLSVGVLPPYWFPSAAIFFPCSGGAKCKHYKRLHQHYAAQRSDGTIMPVLLHSISTRLDGSRDIAAAADLLRGAGLWYEADYNELMGMRGGLNVNIFPAEGVLLQERKPSEPFNWSAAAASSGGGGSGSKPAGAKGDLSLAEAVANVGGPERTLVFCSSSWGYLDFLLNWYRSVEKLGYGPKVLFIAEDVRAYDYLKQRWPRQTVLIVSRGKKQKQQRQKEQQKQLQKHEGRGRRLLEVEKSAAAATVTAAPAVAAAAAADLGGRTTTQAPPSSASAAKDYGSHSYNVMVDRRPKYFEALILLNVTFLYNDVDIVWLRDPFPSLTGDYDMWVQEDLPRLGRKTPKQLMRETQPHDAVRYAADFLCTCIMAVRPTRGSLALVRMWQRVLSIKQRHSGNTATPNQPAFNMALHLARPDVVSVGVLPAAIFPSGFIFFPCDQWPSCPRYHIIKKHFKTNFAHGHIQLAMVHNNWILGHGRKEERFKQWKLWHLKDEDLADIKRLQGQPLSLPAKELIVEDQPCPHCAGGVAAGLTV